MTEYGLTPESLAERARIDAAKIKTWLSVDSDISLSRLRDLADVYKKHWSIFLLEEPSKHFKKAKDYRKKNNSPLGLEAMLAFEEADRLVKLGNEQFGIKLSDDIVKLQMSNNDPVVLASNARKLLGVTPRVQLEWKKPELAYKYLKEALENSGIVVSEQEIKNQSLDGFTLNTSVGASIVVNRKGQNIYRKIFTLLHELGHLLSGESVACETSINYSNRENELFANSFASSFMLPPSMTNVDEILSKPSKDSTISNTTYSLLSKKYSVSMSAIAVWLRRNDYISPAELDNKLTEFDLLFVEAQKRKEAKSKLKKGFDPKGHERKAVDRVGAVLTSRILNDYHEGKATIRDVASRLNVKVHLLEKVESFIGHGNS